MTSRQQEPNSEKAVSPARITPAPRWTVPTLQHGRAEGFGATARRRSVTESSPRSRDKGRAETQRQLLARP